MENKGNINHEEGMDNSSNEYKLNDQTLKLAKEAKKIFSYSGKIESKSNATNTMLAMTPSALLLEPSLGAFLCRLQIWRHPTLGIHNYAPTNLFKTLERVTALDSPCNLSKKAKKELRKMSLAFKIFHLIE